MIQLDNKEFTLTIQTMMYEKTIAHIPFKKRFWDKSTLIVVVMGVQALIVLMLAIVFQTWYLIFVAAFLSFGGYINAHIYHKRVRHFLQGIGVDNDQMVHLHLYYKDEAQELTIPLHVFGVKYAYSGGKDRKAILSLYDGDRLLAKQYDQVGEWRRENLGEVFSSIKTLKNEPISAKEKRMLEGKGLFF